MNNSAKVHQITRLAILVAIIFLLAFTPLGYLVIGPIAATTIQMPVIVGAAVMGPVSGAILMGPAGGAILGFFFGLSAIIKVLTMPGADAFATLALTHSPLAYLAVCMGARVCMGLLTGLLADGLKKIPVLDGKGSIVRYGVTGFVGSALNTVFYLGLLWALCAEVISSFYGVDLSGVGALVMGTAYAAGIPEAIVSCVVVGAICKAVEKSPVMFKRAAV